MRDAPERDGGVSPSGSKSMWRNSGLHLLGRAAAGHLAVTADYVRAQLSRPEVAPIEETCAAERGPHAALMDDPLIAVAPERLQGLADPDSRDNDQIVLAVHGRLAAAGTVEGRYLSVFLEDPVSLPPLFIDQMAHVVVHGVLDGVDDAFLPRAGELLFGEQIVRNRRRLAELDVLTGAAADHSWERGDWYKFALDMTFARPGLDALCRVLERWVWHTGLDPVSSALLNDLYNGVDVGPERMELLLSLFRPEFAGVAAMHGDLAGRPVYPGLEMDEYGRLKLKPQNLLINLPLASPLAAAAFN